ncbi:unnamed protein product [Sphagnum troendelagicum]
MVVVVEEEEQVKRKPWRRAAPHVVAFPFPLQGHIRPFVHFSKRLAAEYDVAITFITTTAHLESTRRELLLQLEEKKDEQEQGEEERFKAIYKTSNNNIQLACFYLPAEYAEPPVCIISDMFLGWTQDTADEFKVAKYCLSSSPTHFISLLCRLPELNAQGRIPAQANGQPYTIPGFPPIAPLDLPRTLQGDQKKSEFLFYHGACLWRATGFLVNSVYELETSIIEGLKDMLQTGCQVRRRILTIGPLDEEIGCQASAREKPQAVEDNDNECLQWLSKQGRESVLYICFGTITAQGKQQMTEIAHGLESSGVHFLWVVRVLKNCENGTIIDVAKLLPEGFIERTKHRGLVYSSWAPQLQILVHPAVKGFLTHCGWNSIMEGIAMGVPMIAWPNYGEQMMNCRLCVDILNIAIPVQKTTGEFEEIVGQDEVKRIAALLMEDMETAHFLKKNVEKHSKSMAAAHAHGGSSKANLDLFVDELNSMTSLTSIIL